MMKRTVGIIVSLLVLWIADPAYALLEGECFDIYGGDYYISFDLSAFSGKQIEDGYVSLNIVNPGMSFDFCGVYHSETESTDSFFGEVYDLGEELAYLKSEGTIIWNAGSTKAYLQGGYNNGITSGYIDGTIKCSKDKVRCSLTAKGGINDYSSFIVSYTSMKGTGFIIWK